MNRRFPFNAYLDYVGAPCRLPYRTLHTQLPDYVLTSHRKPHNIPTTLACVPELQAHTLCLPDVAAREVYVVVRARECTTHIGCNVVLCLVHP